MFKITPTQTFLSTSKTNFLFCRLYF